MLIGPLFGASFFPSSTISTHLLRHSSLNNHIKNTHMSFLVWIDGVDKENIDPTTGKLSPSHQPAKRLSTRKALVDITAISTVPSIKLINTSPIKKVYCVHYMLFTLFH